MAPVERQKPDYNTKLKEQLILQFLHPIYSLVVGGHQHARWDPSTTTLEQRRYACRHSNSYPRLWGGSRTLTAFTILLNNTLSTSSDIEAGITLDTCEKRLLEFGKEILLTHNPEQKLPDTIDSFFPPEQGSKTKCRRQIFYDQVKYIMHKWYSSFPPLPGTADALMKQRIDFNKVQNDEFSTPFNCHFLDILKATKNIVEGKLGNTKSRRELLKSIVVDIQPNENELGGCCDVRQWLEIIEPRHMQDLRSFPNCRLIRYGTLDQETLQSLLTPEERNLLQWHLTYYLQHTPKQPFEYIKKHSDKAPHLPRTIEISSEGSTITVNVLFKAKKVRQKEDGNWKTLKSPLTGTHKQFSRRLRIVYDSQRKEIINISLVGELRPKERPSRQVSDNKLLQYRDYTVCLFQPAITLSEETRKRMLTDCIVTIDRTIKSNSRKGFDYYTVSHVGKPLHDLNQITTETLLSIMEQTLTKLHKIHQAGLCSIDIKPENMIWTDQKSVLYIDADSAVPPNSQTMITGTMEYLAPEFFLYWMQFDTFPPALIEHMNKLQKNLKKNPPDPTELKHATDLEKGLWEIKPLKRDQDTLDLVRKWLTKQLPESHLREEYYASTAADVYALGKTFHELTKKIQTDDKKRQKILTIVNELVLGDEQHKQGMCTTNPEERLTIDKAIKLFDEMIQTQNLDANEGPHPCLSRCG